ncbi:hypothetical protein M378DRAFT_154670 [Amanita muscaria Koide BX008]|uniref:Uncharacterized protein n=1 Tax=Amanita muscaria (strain Koide BX008) TaxID=946122 RepID=A0A0C2T5I9_AMAMK|nr:hypothetical protein M378DRAFT_154670 [Amanita muscaria Koide BX008]
MSTKTMLTSTADGNPRPLKRQRVDTMPISIEGNALDAQNLAPIPPANLLLVLPSLLLHPPTHLRHQLSLELASAAVKKLLSLPDLDGGMECRAWTALAELGIVHGVQEPTVVNEIEKAVAKALLIAQKHPSLRFYKPHLSFLSARMAHEYQDNSKYATHTVRRLLNSLVPSDPPHLLYAAHLAVITYSENESSTRLLDAIQSFQAQAANNGHDSVMRLAQVIRLRVLLREGLLQDVGPALGEAEDSLQMNISSEGLPLETEESAADLCLRLHLLIMGVVYYTYAGDVSSTTSRLTKLHELLDQGSINKLGTTGIIEFPLPGSQPLYVQMSHPRVLYLLAFLVSSVSKRNPVGRKPKRKVFAVEGLTITERELQKEIALPIWASHHDAVDVYGRMHKMKADMLSELAGHSICRSEFDEAERYLDTLIAHTRSTSLFPMYAARITLHHAHLAHSLGQTERALDCYRVAAHLSQPRGEQDDQSNDLEDACSRTPRTPRKRTASPTKGSGLRSLSLSPRKRSVSPKKKRQLRSLDIDEEEQYPEDTWVYTSARAGEIWLRIGLARQRARGEDQDHGTNAEIEELTAEGEAIAQECDGLGGTLKAVGEVIRSCLSGEILRSKGHLRTALELTSAAQDNHLRALVVGLISSHYLHTSRDHAENMLLTCEQLAGGLGAQPRPQKTNHTPSKLPLSSSDKVNIVRKESDRRTESQGATIKAGSKRKINEVDDAENCVPSPKLSRKEQQPDDSLSWGGDDVGNAQLRLWVGERFLELSRWAKNERKVKMQEEKIRKLREAVNQIEKRARLGGVC